MGMFSDLMGKIFHAGAHAGRPPDAVTPAALRPAATAATAAAVAAPPQVDVAAVLDKLAADSKERLDWKHSIVDMLKLLGMDSSLSARKALAADLKYTGNTNDTATMNVWLHKEVMRKVAENGGKVPADLLGH